MYPVGNKFPCVDGASIPKCVVLVNEQLHPFTDFLPFLLGAFCRAVQCCIFCEGLLHLPQVCLPETVTGINKYSEIGNGSAGKMDS